jgi:hypothetical protein
MYLFRPSLTARLKIVINWENLKIFIPEKTFAAETGLKFHILTRKSIEKCYQNAVVKLKIPSYYNS